jgi:hypothetical protein
VQDRTPGSPFSLATHGGSIHFGGYLSYGRGRNNARAGFLETNFDEFSACSDAEAVFGGVVCVSVTVAPRGILLVVHMANDPHRDQNDGYADD